MMLRMSYFRRLKTHYTHLKSWKWSRRFKLDRRSCLRIQIAGKRKGQTTLSLSASETWVADRPGYLRKRLKLLKSFFMKPIEPVFKQSWTVLWQNREPFIWIFIFAYSVKRTESVKTFIWLNKPSYWESLRPTGCVKPWFGIDLAQITGP